MDVTCMTCKKKYDIDATDSQYQKLKKGETKYYFCSDCNRSIQGSASTSAGININDLDHHDKALRRK